MPIPKLQILLATYNQCQYLPSLLSSLFGQTFSNWNLITRDNGSTDNAVKIVDQFSKHYPGRILRIEDDLGNIGACRNFGRLLEASTADYIMFCDSDDVWIENKVEKALSEIDRLEGIYGTSTPLLVHTDLTVTDRNLKIIDRSYWRYQNIDPTKTSLSQLLVQNVVTGCTVIINRALRDQAAPIPEEAIMHDWWLALVACLFGHISKLDEPSLFYRQHGANDTGAKRWNMYVQDRLVDMMRTKERVARYQHQCHCLLDRFADRINGEQVGTLKDFGSLSQCAKIKRMQVLFKHKIFKHGVTRNIGLFTYI